MPKRTDINTIKSIFASRGYKLLSDSYNSCKDKLDYECPIGHKGSITLGSFKEGRGCTTCANKNTITTDVVKEAMIQERYTLVSNYVNSKTHLQCICPNGHTYSITWNNWKTGYRCNCESGRTLLTENDVIDILKKEDYKLVSDYKGTKYKINTTCPNNHSYQTTMDRWLNSGSRCPKCKEWGTSNNEKELVSYIKSIYTDEIITNDRKLIAPYELDIVIPDKKVAIEYCGLFWHSELAGKSNKYHLNKLNRCNKLGYRLITIFEDEWINHKEVVLSKLSNILNINTSKVLYARKCIVKEIDSNIAKQFCESNHVQGYSNASIKLGAFYNDELVSVMTFSKPSLAKGNKVTTIGVYELSRFCSKVDTRIIGVASKLLKYFETNYEWTSIFSYADRRWSIGNVYDKLGFEFVKILKPNYWYFVSTTKRIHRFNLRKDDTLDRSLTEWISRQKQGYDRIWDCGNLKYIKYNNVT